MGDAITLCQLTAHGNQFVSVAHGFNAFRDYLKGESVGQADYTIDYRQIVLIDQHVPHETLVYLKYVDRQMPEISQ